MPGTTVIVTFKIERLKRMQRPAGYLDELRAVVLSTTSTAMKFDTDSPGYRALQEKYKDHPRELECVYRGVQVDSVKCETCVGNVNAKVLACSIHDRCTLFAKPIDDVKSCRDCADRATVVQTHTQKSDHPHSDSAPQDHPPLT